MPDRRTRSRKRTPSNDQRPYTRAALLHRMSRSLPHGITVDIVRIVFHISLASVYRVGGDGLVADKAKHIGDLIRGVEEIPAWKPNFAPLNGALYRTRLKIGWKTGKGTRAARSDSWWCWRIVVFNSELFRVCTARKWAKIGGFVHINPQAININASFRTEEVVELSIPEGLGSGVEPIREGRNTRPYHS